MVCAVDQDVHRRSISIVVLLSRQDLCPDGQDSSGNRAQQDKSSPRGATRASIDNRDIGKRFSRCQDGESMGDAGMGVSDTW
jgi:hypothetical protein